MNGAKKWPLGFGVLYVMMHVPFVVFTKIGITGVGAGKRAKQIDEAVFGFPLPVAIMVLPFVYQIEQFLHALFSPLRVRFYKGDGHTEWFLFIAGAAVFYLCWWWYWPFVWRCFEVVVNKL